MSDQAVAIPPDAVAAEIEAESHAPYLKVWFGLLVFTVIEYFYARIFKDYFTLLVLGLMFCALIKAGMVGWYFMHLKFEGNWVYILIAPTLLLATILTFALMPDMSLKYDESEDRAAEPETSNARAIGTRPTFDFMAVLDS